VDPTLQNKLQTCIDRQEITEVLYRRARAGDRADAELAHSCYHTGATERHGSFEGLAKEFIDVVSYTRPRPGSPVIGMFHFVGNVTIDFDGADKAFVESYHVAWVKRVEDGKDIDVAVGGRYLDRFERRGHWAIVHREVIFDWTRKDPGSRELATIHPPHPELVGKRGADDPLYRHIARGG
jgi:hypothetical protein